MKTKIYKVTNVSKKLIKTNPPILVIDAQGEVNTTGWSNGVLEQYIYVHPPLDGIYEFSFIAEAPTCTIQEIITPITASSFEWPDPPADLKGVKVYSDTNHITCK